MCTTRFHDGYPDYQPTQDEVPVDRKTRALVWRIFLAAWAIVVYLIWN